MVKKNVLTQDAPTRADNSGSVIEFEALLPLEKQETSRDYFFASTTDEDLNLNKVREHNHIDYGPTGTAGDFCGFMINELVSKKHYSFSRIAKRCNVSTSTIRKLALEQTKEPRHTVFSQLLVLFHRVLTNYVILNLRLQARSSSNSQGQIIMLVNTGSQYNQPAES